MGSNESDRLVALVQIISLLNPTIVGKDDVYEETHKSKHFQTGLVGLAADRN